jgi:thymidylate synthase
MNKLDLDYQNLLKDILENGTKKETRNGGTISVFGRQIRHNMKDGFPLLTTKKMPFKTIVTELLWFLQGDTNIKFLVDNNCHIWNGDAAKKYIEKTYTQDWRSKCKDPEKAYKLLVDQFIENIKNSPEFAAEHGELGPIYGKQWRRWDLFGYEWELSQIVKKGKVDQIQNLINDLKTNPDSRRLMVNA